MKVFIALNFKDNIKSEIYSIIEKLKLDNIEGKFVSQFNLHLTIIYIGETDKIQLLKDIIDNIDIKSFNIELNNLGFFHNKGGNIFWIGIAENKILNNLYNELYLKLGNLGFILDSRKYCPHITLARKLKLNDDEIHRYFLDYNYNKDIFCNSISLMCSERINDELIYREIYKKDLSN